MNRTLLGHGRSKVTRAWDTHRILTYSIIYNLLTGVRNRENFQCAMSATFADVYFDREVAE